MPDITVSITDIEQKSLEFAMVSIQDWTDNAVTNRARIAKNDIIKLLVAYCNENNIQIATGEDAQVIQAYDLGVVKTAADRAQEPIDIPGE